MTEGHAHGYRLVPIGYLTIEKAHTHDVLDVRPRKCPEQRRRKGHHKAVQGSTSPVLVNLFHSSRCRVSGHHVCYFPGSYVEW